jgi:hypothetical protein
MGFEVYSSFDSDGVGRPAASDWSNWRSQKYPWVQKDQMDMERQKYQIQEERGRWFLAGEVQRRPLFFCRPERRRDIGCQERDVQSAISWIRVSSNCLGGGIPGFSENVSLQNVTRLHEGLLLLGRIDVVGAWSSFPEHGKA